MALRYRVTGLTSTGGDVVTLPTTGVTCVVGGNNAGKSQLLREIEARSSRGEENLAPLAVREITVERPDATVEETDAWLRDFFFEKDRGPGMTAAFDTAQGGASMTAEEVAYWYPLTHQGFAYLGNIQRFFVRYVTAGTLTSRASGVLQIGEYGEANAELEYLLKDGEVEEQFSAAVFEVFRQRILLDRASGQISLKVGEVAVPVPPLNRPTREYATAISNLPYLDNQGDGLRSFAGLALQILTGRPNLLIVDEPEAFLHPGQARAVGRWLARESAARDIQLVMATHDRDMVLGLIEGGAGAPVNILRVTREGDDARLAQLEPDQVRAVWDSPVLRYSNILQGLFHRKVVICESDGDCRFYGAALDELAQTTGQRALADDILLVPSGGKAAINTLAAALMQLKVQAEAIVDFDVLRSRPELKGIVTSLGATWTTEMDTHYTTFVGAPNGGSVAWETLKHAGLSAVPAGAANAAAVALLGLLDGVGVHVVPVGEMEGFMRSSGQHGPTWVTEALEEGTHKAAAVANFVRPLLA